MSEHSVDEKEKPMLYCVNDVMNNTENISETDGSFHSLAKVLGVPRSEAGPNDHFILFKTLSVGKFGATYLGHDKATNAIRTFKLFRPICICGHSKAAKMEKRILTLRIRPTMIPQLFMSFSFENCLVLESFSGKTLQDKLRFARRLPELAIRFYMNEIVFVISFLHSKQVIHRNLNLDSFWVMDSGHLKLMDFTMCVPFNSVFKRLSWTNHPNHFTAPEIIKGGFITKMVDIWAMGVIMYRMTTGKMPFLTTNRKDFKHAIRFSSVNFSHHFTTDAQHFCAGLMAKLPQHRIGYHSTTFAAMEAHEYFAHTNWDKVLLGVADVPYIPILFNNEMTVLECDLNLLSGIRYKLRKKPLRFNEITSKKGHEIFSDANLLELHRRKIAKDIKRQKHKQPPQDFSYLKVANEDFLWGKDSHPLDQRDFVNISKTIAQAIEAVDTSHPDNHTHETANEKKTAIQQIKDTLDNYTPDLRRMSTLIE
ncbi:RAC serine/threonine-protein kinase-like isoform X2 [Biomphalaria glabrata]|uniref:RAC serine/threonine-protein kinase-like isoform X2 n=1 Tax=Biomphalaria glabrata TaxID=6526 RepID=A0A9W2YKH8_BIOGL|nr:RAC serine/threonine-protein kinase-like isoform X2 [Biomphalaria glabrata]